MCKEIADYTGLLFLYVLQSSCACFRKQVNKLGTYYLFRKNNNEKKKKKQPNKVCKYTLPIPKYKSSVYLEYRPI